MVKKVYSLYKLQASFSYMSFPNPHLTQFFQNINPRSKDANLLTKPELESFPTKAIQLKTNVMDDVIIGETFNKQEVWRGDH